MSVLNPEYFSTLREFLEPEPGHEPPEPPAWPGELREGCYHCAEADCQRPALNPLDLCEWAGAPGLTCTGVSGYVQASTEVEHLGQSMLRWELSWDDGSGGLRDETLWLHIDSDESFTLHDAQGRSNRYRLQQPAMRQAIFWPEPLLAGHYQASGPAPAGMQSLILLEFMDGPALQTADAAAMTGLRCMQFQADGSLQATISWVWMDGSGVEPETQIALQIRDAEHFCLTDAQGQSTVYRWVGEEDC